MGAPTLDHMLGVQRSFDDLGEALVDTTFCVVDLETTGGSADSAITEIGAVKVRGGEVLGEFQTLVDPGSPIPPFITVLTGISDAMVIGAPRIEEALPAFLEFADESVIVAHNAAFDTRFLSTESRRLGYRPPPGPVVCTVRLARRLVRDEVPNLRLETLARAVRARTPCHRALDDARATVDVLHALLELAGRWGVAHLDDLLWFQSASGHPQARKRILTSSLPRGRGVYLFRGPGGELLYVGKATDLRSRVRSYFSADDRRGIGNLLRELHSVEPITTRLDIESSVIEARLIRAFGPPYNRAGRGRSKPAWVRLTSERFPRVVVARSFSPDALGPVSSTAAWTLREALEEAAPIRRCNDRIGPRTVMEPCVLAQIGRCPAPCDGRITPASYVVGISRVSDALGGDPSAALVSLEARMTRLSEDRRYEEAAATRDRAASLVHALSRSRVTAALQRAGRLLIERDGHTVEGVDGCVESIDGSTLAVPGDGHADEVRLIAAWLRRDRHARLTHVSGVLDESVFGGAALAAWRARLDRARKPRP